MSGDAPATGLVIGVGNDWCGDDGFGPAVADALLDQLLAGLLRGRVAIRRAHQLTPELAADVARCAHLVVVDASLDERPGRLARRVLRGEAPGGGPIAAGAGGHGFGPDELLELTELAYGSRPPATLVVAGADPGAMEPGMPLGDRMRALVPVAAAEVLAVLEQLPGRLAADA